MTPQELKASILQMAIQGKLVEQRPEEGTGEKLYQQIQTEKQALIKSGKIKKEKSLPEITEDEIPFDIPENWMWVRLNSVITLLSGSDLSPAKYNDAHKGMPYITGASNIEGEHLIINRWTEYPNNIAHKGDLLLTCKGTVGKTAVLYEPAVHIARQLMAITVILADLKYLKCFLESQVDALKTKAKSMIPGIERDSVLRLLLPLPPLAEQKRIVAKIEELLPYIDRYEQAWSRLEDFNKRFPVDMQKSILQMAIQGKLVPQIPEEGTGEELLQQIQTEKQALIKAGKIKKEKPLPEITEDEIPFDIPESWKWVRVVDYVQKVTDYVASGSFASLRENVKIYKEPNYAILVKTKDFQSNFTNDLTYTDKHGYEFLENSRLFGGELIMPNIGASIGKVFKVPYLDAKMTLAPNSVLIRFVSEEHLDWFSYYFASPIGFAQLKTISASTAQAKFSKTEFKGLLIPVPPLAEQKRIVAKLEEILPLCERLK